MMGQDIDVVSGIKSGTHDELTDSLTNDSQLHKTLIRWSQNLAIKASMKLDV